MSKKQYFSSYKSPNIYIVPSASICYPPPPKKSKVEKPIRDKSPQNIDVSFLDDFDVDEIVKCLNDCDGNTQNTAKQQNISNNNIILEKDKSSFEVANNNERNNKELMIIIENTHTNMNTNNTIEKDETVSSKNYNENKHADIHIAEEDNAEIFDSQITKQSNDKTCNTITNSPLNIVNTNNGTTNHMENNTENTTTQEKEKKIIQKCLLKTEQDLDSKNKTPEPFDGDGKIKCNTIKRTIDNKGCKKTYLEYSDVYELQNKDYLSIVEVEFKIDKFNSKDTIQNKQFCNTHKVPNSYETEILKNIDSSQIVNNNEVKVKAQEAIENQQNDKSKPKNLEEFMFQYLYKHYCVISLIHSGQYSKIFKCKDSKDKHYAVKMLKNKGNEYRKEIMWSKIQGDIPKENLLCVYLIAGFELNKNWCYLTDFYPKNLKDVLKESKKNLSIDTIQELAGQLVGAVTTLRNKNIVHSDINPGHVLLDCTNSKLRLCGFDQAYYIEDANLFPYKGTECYRAPEVILGYSAGFSLDVWSTALVLHEMATGIQLFGGWVSTHVLYRQICILGDIPPQMLLRSRYRNKYPIEYSFDGNRCLKQKHNTIVKRKNKIASTIQGAYYAHWTEGKNYNQISNDMQKIRQFTRLLEKMLVIYPEQRLPIEFVYSNPFIYKGFNN